MLLYLQLQRLTSRKIYTSTTCVQQAVHKNENQVSNSTRLDPTSTACDNTDNPANATGDTTLRPNWWTWPVVDVDTSATAVIYLNPRDDPTRSPSLAPGQVLPKVQRGGGRATPVKKVGHGGIRKQVSRKKRDRYDAHIRSLVRDQARDPARHPRQYVLDSANPVYPVPAPTCYTNYTGPDRQQLPGRVIMRYRVVDVPYFPAVTTTAPTAAITAALFGDGKCFTYASLSATTDEINQKGNLSRSTIY